MRPPLLPVWFYCLAETNARLPACLLGSLFGVDGHALHRSFPVREPHNTVPSLPPSCQDMDPEKVLACPRTKVGDRLGRFIVNRLKVCGMLHPGC